MTTLAFMEIPIPKELARETFHSTLHEVRALRDEIKVQVHLGSLEARDAFADLEHKIRDVEREVKQRGEAARDELKARLQDVRDGLHVIGGNLP
jgi:hypothetical protein